MEDASDLVITPDASSGKPERRQMMISPAFSRASFLFKPMTLPGGSVTDQAVAAAASVAGSPAVSRTGARIPTNESFAMPQLQEYVGTLEKARKSVVMSPISAPVIPVAPTGTESPAVKKDKTADRRSRAHLQLQELRSLLSADSFLLPARSAMLDLVLFRLTPALSVLSQSSSKMSQAERTVCRELQQWLNAIRQCQVSGVEPLTSVVDVECADVSGDAVDESGNPRRIASVLESGCRALELLPYFKHWKEVESLTQVLEELVAESTCETVTEDWVDSTLAFDEGAKRLWKALCRKEHEQREAAAEQEVPAVGEEGEKMDAPWLFSVSFDVLWEFFRNDVASDERASAYPEWFWEGQVKSVLMVFANTDMLSRVPAFAFAAFAAVFGPIERWYWNMLNVLLDRPEMYHTGFGAFNPGQFFENQSPGTFMLRLSRTHPRCIVVHHLSEGDAPALGQEVKKTRSTKSPRGRPKHKLHTMLIDALPQGGVAFMDNVFSSLDHFVNTYSPVLKTPLDCTRFQTWYASDTEYNTVQDAMSAFNASGADGEFTVCKLAPGSGAEGSMPPAARFVIIVSQSGKTLKSYEVEEQGGHFQLLHDGKTIRSASLSGIVLRARGPLNLRTARSTRAPMLGGTSNDFRRTSVMAEQFLRGKERQTNVTLGSRKSPREKSPREKPRFSNAEGLRARDDPKRIRQISSPNIHTPKEECEEDHAKRIKSLGVNSKGAQWERDVAVSWLSSLNVASESAEDVFKAGDSEPETVQGEKKDEMFGSIRGVLKRRNFWGKWVRGFYVCLDGTLREYKPRDKRWVSMKDPIHAWVMKDCTVVHAESMVNKKNSFALLRRKKDPVYLQAPNSKELTEWTLGLAKLSMIPNVQDLDITVMRAAVVASKENGKIVKVNEPALEMFGYAEEELIGKNVKMLMPAEVAQYHSSYMARYMKKKDRRLIGRTRIVQGVHKDGRVLDVCICLGEYFSQGKRYFFASFFHENSSSGSRIGTESTEDDDELEDDIDWSDDE